MRRHLCAFVLLCLGFAAFASAQNRANFPWWNSPVTADLNLSPAQSHQIHQIVRSYRDRLFDARNAQQKAEADLEDLLNDPEVTPDSARPVIERLATARANTSRVFLEMSVKLRSVLTLDQWRILVRRWDDVQRKKPSDTQVLPE
jgi:hypothetical protein